MSTLRSVLGGLGKLFAKDGGTKAVADVSMVTLRPSVAGPEGWKTASLQVPYGLSKTLRLDSYLAEHYDVSWNLINRLLRQGRVRVSRATQEQQVSSADAAAIFRGALPAPTIKEASLVKTIRPTKSIPLQGGDLILLTDIVLPEPKRKPEISTSEDIAAFVQSLVVYRDDRIIVLNKPTGLAVHVGPGLSEHLEGWLDSLRFGNHENPRLVHRLDKGTSGLLVLAHGRETAAHLQSLFSETTFDQKRIDKTYLALVEGNPTRLKNKGEIHSNIYQMVAKNGQERMTSFADQRADLMDEGKAAITHYRWLQQHRNNKERCKLSLMELRPLTGRTHQIRVHLAEQLGMPVLGDYRYGQAAPRRDPNRCVHHKDLPLHLHSYHLLLRDWHCPGKHLDLHAPIPKHFIETMDKHPLKLRDLPNFVKEQQKFNERRGVRRYYK